MFFAHYLLPSRVANPGTLRLHLLTGLTFTAQITLPIFFVLSGYLIGGILLDTRHRGGYFRVFYVHRMLRTFPVFYVTLLVIATFEWAHQFPLSPHFWSHFLYIQNLYPSYVKDMSGGAVTMTHFWSLAVEEQFYLLWPLVVWLLPSRRKLFAVSALLVALCFIVRLSAPIFPLSPSWIRYFTPTRIDAIFLGVMAALLRGSQILEKLKTVAKWFALGGIAAMATLGAIKEETWSGTYQAEEIWIPLVNFTAFAIILAVLEEDSWISRVCGQRWICWLGSISYSLYVIHLTFSPYFRDTLSVELSQHMRRSFAALAAGAAAFAATMFLGVLSYYLLEKPVRDLKRHVRYDGPKHARTPVGSRNKVPVEIGA